MEATAKNIDKTARTAREMAEAQRDSFEALAENFASAQRRSMGLAEGGLEFVRLQEDNARAAQEFFAHGVRLLQLQGRNAEFVQGWTEDAVERHPDQCVVEGAAGPGGEPGTLFTRVRGRVILRTSGVGGSQNFGPRVG